MKPLWEILGTGPENKVPDVIYVIVEVSKETKQKYEMDEKTGALILDRDLFTSMVYPGDYGLIPGTMSEDGDPADALVLVSQSHFPGTVIPSRPIGLLKMKDEKGRDNKILCVPDKNVDPRYKDVNDVKDLPSHVIAEIKHFFKHMKELEPEKWVKLEGIDGAEEAKKSLNNYIKAYKQKL